VYLNYELMRRVEGEDSSGEGSSSGGDSIVRVTINLSSDIDKMERLAEMTGRQSLKSRL